MSSMSSMSMTETTYTLVRNIVGERQQVSRPTSNPSPLSPFGRSVGYLLFPSRRPIEASPPTLGAPAHER